MTDGAAPAVVIALMIGEVGDRPDANAITRRIVQEAAEICARHQHALLVCESAPMSRLAALAGVATDRVVTALPQRSGHTTRLVGEWLRRQRAQLPSGAWWMVTHALHAARAVRIFRRLGVPVRPVPVDAPFDPHDADWKLRSAPHFRVYNAAATAYCGLRGWL